MATQQSTLRVGVDSTDMVTGAKKGKLALVDLGDSATKTDQVFNKLNDRTSLLQKAFRGLMALGVAAFFTQIIMAAGGFETKMAEISTLVDTTVFQLERLEDALLSNAIAFGAQPVDQAAAAYQIISAGAGNATEAIQTLDAANRLAIGGVTDVATAADGLTSVLNAYGMAADQATDVSDVMFVGMRAGKTTIGELASTLGNVAPLASQAGVGFDELVAAIAALTKGGMATAQAVTGVRAILAAVVKPTKEAADMAGALGIQFDAAALKSQGFAGFMGTLTKATGGNTEALAQLFGGVEALVPVLALAGQAGVDMTSILADMETRGGATAEAFEKMTNTFDFQAARVRGGLTVAYIKLGEIITGALTPVLRVLADNFENIVRFVQAAALSVTVAMIPALLTLIPTIAVATAGLVAMAAAWLLTPFGQISALIMAASAALVYFGNVNVSVGGVSTTVWQTFTAAVGVAWDLIKEGAAIVGGVMSAATGYASDFFNKVLGWLGSMVSGWGDTFTSIGGIVKDSINSIIGFHVGLISAIGPVITQGIPAMFMVAMGAAQNAVVAAMQFIISTVVSALGGVGDALSYIPGVADDLGSKIRGALDVDLSGLRADTTALTTDLTNAGSAISDAFGSAQIDYIGKAGEVISTVGDNLQDRLVARLTTANEEVTELSSGSVELGDIASNVVAPALDKAGGSAKGAADAMSKLNDEKERFLEGIDEEFARIQEANGGAVESVRKWYEEQSAMLSQLGMEYTAYAEKLEVIFGERMAEAYQKDLANATDWRSGIERAVSGLGESVGNESDLAEMALTSVFDNAASAISEFAKTGKLDFKKFAQSVAADILMMTTKMLLLKALKGIMGGFSEGGAVGDALPGFATGGYVSGAGGPTSDSIPAMLSNGEYVVNAQATKQFAPLLAAINAGNMDMAMLAAGGLSNESASLPAQPQAAAKPLQENKADDSKQGGGNITIVPTINTGDIVDAFDSDDGDRVIINMLERNKTTIRGLLS